MLERLIEVVTGIREHANARDRDAFFCGVLLSVAIAWIVIAFVYDLGGSWGKVLPLGPFAIYLVAGVFWLSDVHKDNKKSAAADEERRQRLAAHDAHLKAAHGEGRTAERDRRRQEQLLKWNTDMLKRSLQLFSQAPNSGRTDGNTLRYHMWRYNPSERNATAEINQVTGVTVVPLSGRSEDEKHLGDFPCSETMHFQPGLGVSSIRVSLGTDAIKALTDAAQPHRCVRVQFGLQGRLTVDDEPPVAWESSGLVRGCVTT